MVPDLDDGDRDPLPGAAADQAEAGEGLDPDANVPGLPDDEALELESRRRIFRFVSEHPGAHMREIGRELDVPMGTLEYHLRYLVNEDILTRRDEGRYTRYFVTHQMGRREKDILTVLRLERPRRIAAFLLLHPDASHGEILEEFDVAASTLSFHLKKLVDAGIVEKHPEGRSNRYEVVEPNLVARVLITYQESFLDDVVDRFAEVWLGLEP